MRHGGDPPIAFYQDKIHDGITRTTFHGRPNVQNQVYIRSFALFHAAQPSSHQLASLIGGPACAPCARA